MSHAIVASGVGTERELRLALADEDIRSRYNETLEIARLLSNCIIDRNYTVSDALARPIRLTAFGERVSAEILDQRKRTKPNELRMAMFLAFGCANGILVDPFTDLDAMRKAISTELSRGRICYPYIYGRDLHDTAADLFPGKSRLDNRQTLKLLRSLPVGVYQGGFTTVGPFGCITSEERRSLPPDDGYKVPGYLCADETCDAVHPINLHTGDSAVLKTSEAINKFLLEKHSSTNNENARLIAKARTDVHKPFRLDSYGPLIDTFADGLSLKEKRAVVDTMLRTKFRAIGNQQALSKKLGILIGDPSVFVDTLNEAQLLQIILLHKDSDLIHAIDRTVLSGAVPIPAYEVRKKRLSRWKSGPYRIRAEIGWQGVRFTAPATSGLVARKLLELLHHLYFQSGVLDPEELVYLLDGAEGVSEQELLDFAVRTLSPSEALQQFALGTKRAALEAANYMCVADADTLSRADRLKRLAWKLGIESPDPIFNDLERIESAESDLRSALDGSPSEEVLRGHISNLFAASEDALSQALTFSAWSLTTDHYLEPLAFTYDPGKNISVAVDFLDKHAPEANSDLLLRRTGKNTLVPLAASFSRLAKCLRSLRKEEHLRPAHQAPAESRSTTRPFAFPSNVFFLNLTDKSQEDVIQALQVVARLMQDEAVVKVRNATIHGNNEFPTRSEIFVALEKISKWRLHLTATGLYPQTYVLRETRRDSLGNTTVTYSHGENVVKLESPSWAVAPNLPNTGPQLVVMSVARISSAGPLRFTLLERPGGTPYWDGWPRRWSVVHNYMTPDHDDTPGDAVREDLAAND